MAIKSKPLELPFPSPASRAIGSGASVNKFTDVRANFADITKKTPRDGAAEKAFLASKMHMVMTHPTLDLAARKASAAYLRTGIEQRRDSTPTGPIPGGVGYGVFYNPSFKNNWANGTAIHWEIICPTPPGGNVNTTLYLTATNRSGKGVEAFIAYNGQNETFFKVFDWAQFPASPWQTNIPFASLANYTQSASAHGSPYQVLQLINSTRLSSEANYWQNQVFFWNHSTNGWDQVYAYGYTASLEEQQNVWPGSWGPIVETFQNPYQGTNPMGALNTQLIGYDSNGQPGSWYSPGPSDCYIRNDHTGFNQLFLDPNYSWAVNS